MYLTNTFDFEIWQEKTLHFHRQNDWRFQPKSGRSHILHKLNLTDSLVILHWVTRKPNDPSRRPTERYLGLIFHWGNLIGDAQINPKLAKIRTFAYTQTVLCSRASDI